jgi:diguanylate cyclase (GGDEF)-like protein/PAS domain S-box-containing protein
MKAATESSALDVAVQDECVPADEADRLASLHRLGLLDTEPSEGFDAVARVAATALRVPVVLVSLVDAERLWFKAQTGLSARESPRQSSFCAQVIFQRHPLAVRDAVEDPRFARFALVTGAPPIRSYLGVPLYSSDGQPVGTLCAMDNQVREYGERELAVLRELAPIVEELLCTRQSTPKADNVLQYAMEREKLFRETFELAAVGIVHTSLRGTILRINQRACAMLGYSVAQLRGLNFLDITHAEDLPNNVREFKRALAGEFDSYRLEQRLLCKDQRYAWVSMSVPLRRSATRLPDYSIVIIDDISAKKHAEADLLKARDALQERLTQLEQRLQESDAALQAQGKRALEAAAALREAQDKQALEAAATLREAQDKQALEAAAALREAQAALQTANAKLAAEIATDSLTGLPNRRSFGRRVEQAAIALRLSRKPYGLILLDLDNFKHVNNENGHDVGDEVLRAIGKILASQLRNSSDMAARLDGDEFAVLCFGDINEQALHEVADRIRSQIGKEPLATPTGLLRFTASLGLALSLPDDPDWKALYARADAALFEAKAAGKDRVSFGRSASKSATARLRALSSAAPPTA